MDSAHVRTTYLATAATVVDFLSKPEVTSHWTEESVLDQFSVGGLAAHLGRSITMVRRYLEEPAGGDPETDAGGYFADLEETGDVDSDLNVAVRDRSEETAAKGPEPVVEECEDALADLQHQLPQESEESVVRVFQGRVMLLDEYLKTRLVEMVVHLEDLALSIGVGLGVGWDAVILATDTVVAAARHRHGDMAVLRAMTRRERDSLEATRVF